MLILWLERAAELPRSRHDDLTWLGEPERRRCESLGSAQRREEFLAGRFLLRRMLLAHGLVAAEPLSFTAQGAPRLQGRPDLYLSLSHRRGWQVAATSDAPVGVDVEIQSPRDVPDFAARSCTAGEARHLAALPPDAALAHLHELWALKEAAFKAAFPAPQDHRPRQLEAAPAPPGCGTARTWRWPDGRVLAIVAGGFERFEGIGMGDAASGPACWWVRQHPSEPGARGPV